MVESNRVHQSALAGSDVANITSRATHAKIVSKTFTFIFVCSSSLGSASSNCNRKRNNAAILETSEIEKGHLVKAEKHLESGKILELHSDLDI